MVPKRVVVIKRKANPEMKKRITNFFFEMFTNFSLPHAVNFARAGLIHFGVVCHFGEFLFHLWSRIYISFHELLISREAGEFAHHHHFVVLPCHVGHDVDELLLAPHHFLEHFGNLGSIARIAYKSVVYNNHKFTLNY